MPAATMSVHNSTDRYGIRPRLEVDNITFLDNGPYTFSVTGGECVGIIGASGIGKTQLLKVLVDLIPHKGSVCWDNQEMAACPAPSWRSRIAMIPAESSWWHDSAGPHFIKEGHEDNVHSLLGRVGLQSKVLQWQISRLSTGERQRLALVRALVLNPQVVLLDEPTSALDAKHTLLVESLLHDYCLSKQAAILWVSHDMEQLNRVAARCVKVDKNRLIEDGTL